MDVLSGGFSRKTMQKQIIRAVISLAGSSGMGKAIANCLLAIFATIPYETTTESALGYRVKPETGAVAATRGD